MEVALEESVAGGCVVSVLAGLNINADGKSSYPVTPDIPAVSSDMVVDLPKPLGVNTLYQFCGVFTPLYERNYILSVDIKCLS